MRLMTSSASSSGRPADDSVVKMHINELTQLFNSLDPSPFYEKEIDRNAEEYIVRSTQELPGKSPVALVVYLDTTTTAPD